MTLLWSPPALCQQITSPVSQQVYQRQTLLKTLAKTQVIYLGETHDSLQDHQAQLEIIQALYQQNPKLAIALEMFQRPFQPILDRYVAGQLTEVEFQQQSEYEQRWGFSWQLYAPILRFAKQHRLPLLALNTPTEVTRKVAKQGLASLSPPDLKFIPPVAEIDTSNSAYRAKIREVYEQFHQGKTSSTGFENFFAAQVLWDETMAAAIAQFVQANPGYQVIVLVGQGHLVYGYGIPSRVQRRMAKTNQPFKQSSILLNPDPELSQKTTVPVADYLWSDR
ncbi:MAG: ChaN family lipoprotein [Aphanocapsa sp. GSE-SYN-MK-11-07L]|jgi:uncharacterized iron-regulated protein|nr:ChaN family lipoprotein [Aphanocapsa sp. GSE-SYN-MK-11-07L]